MLFCFLRLYWVFIKGAISVSSKQVAVCVILIFKTLHFFVFVCYVLFWACFWLRDFGLFVVVVFVIDFTIDWWDGFSYLLCFVLSILLIEWLRGLFFLIVWCNFVLVIYWTVVLYEKEEKLWSDGALQVAVVKPCVKMSALWFKRLIF